MDEKILDDFWAMRFGLRRSFFYHEKRIVFWRTSLFFAQGLEMALNSTAAAFLFNSNGTTTTRWIVLASAIISGIVVWFNAEKRIQANMEKKALFHDLIGRIPRRQEKYTEELLDEIEKARLDIERDDDVVLPCVDALARNDACRSLGIPEDSKLNFIERTIGRVLPIPYIKKSQVS